MESVTALATAPHDPNPARFAALGTTIKVVTIDPLRLPSVVQHVHDCFVDIDRTFSRFRADSELSRLERTGGGPQPASGLFLELLDLAYRASTSTGGWFDPTIRDALEASGYDRSIEWLEAEGPGPARPARPAGQWHLITYDRNRRLIDLRDGVRLDFGGIGKGFAVDYALRTLPPGSSGVLVNAGGDLAVSGPAPDGGWICDVATSGDSAVEETVRLREGALATSGLGRRQWTRDGRLLHHLIDPRTGQPGESPWRTVTVVARTCVAAEVAAKVAWLRGAEGPAWLESIGLSGRFAGIDGCVQVAGNWPRQQPEGM
ncbi:MAG TPA: FAD:protein FMN transferase [Nitrolancea sp.]|jgi:thiamine biosynthesis lipoprotein|nr:FAD:protein FMN transferase [Nitrolancea sp.]